MRIWGTVQGLPNDNGHLDFQADAFGLRASVRDGKPLRVQGQVKAWVDPAQWTWNSLPKATTENHTTTIKSYGIAPSPGCTGTTSTTAPPDSSGAYSFDITTTNQETMKISCRNIDISPTLSDSYTCVTGTTTDSKTRDLGTDIMSVKFFPNPL